MTKTFKIGLSPDFLNASGEVAFGDIGLGMLEDRPDVEWEFMHDVPDELRPEDIAPYDGLLLLMPRVTKATLEGVERLAVIARFGVGVDSIDLEACTDAGVAVTVTPDGVRRPVATAMLTSVLVLAHRVLERDRLVRTSRWGDKLDYLGVGLTGRTVGIVGLGSIGFEFARLSLPLEMRRTAFDPYASPDAARAAGVELVDLDRLLAESDFVCVSCPLTEETHHLIDQEALHRMKPTAFLVNLARGPIVDEVALVEALRSGTIAGAALDVFDPEPPLPDNPLFAMENVVLTPHCIAHTDECFRLTGTSAVTSLLDVAAGRRPAHVVNARVTDTPRFAQRLADGGSHDGNPRKDSPA